MEEQVIKEIVVVLEKYNVSISETITLYRKVMHYIQDNTPVNTATKPVKLYD